MPQGLSIYILLILAVAAGWFVGRLGFKREQSSGNRTQKIFDDYFVGLNYLLNDEPDEAVDTFIKALEVNSDTIETHLALGALLRRRGKVDKAIKVHQSLLARPGLDPDFMDSTRLQLAVDYVAAGLLDRAERLLNEILDDNTPAKWEALSQLVTLYQTEKEWQSAVRCAEELLANSALKRDADVRSAAAHFCCELADAALERNRMEEARESVKRAFEFDRRCARASLLLGSIEHKAGHYRTAIRELERVRSNNPEFVGQTLATLADCYLQLGRQQDYEKLLRSVLAERADVRVAVALTELIQERDGAGPAIEFLSGFLAHTPSLRGLIRLLELQNPGVSPELGEQLSTLQQLLDDALQKKPGYRCSYCGFDSRNLYWLCPSCQKWDKIQPIAESG